MNSVAKSVEIPMCFYLPFIFITNQQTIALRPKTIAGIHGGMVTAEKILDKDSPGSYSINESIDLQVFLQNGEWDLVSKKTWSAHLTLFSGTPGKRVVTAFDKESYHELYYYIYVRRRTLAYGINLIIPSLVISMMTVLGFTLPPEAGEKMTLGIVLSHLTLNYF